MNIGDAKSAFQNILKSLNKEDRSRFLSWCENFIDVSNSKAYFDLRTIAEDIKSMIPMEAILPSEIILKDDNTSEPVIHVDSFLFEDEHIDALVDEGKLKRNYCQDCRSFNIAPIVFISHSTSLQRIQYMFQNMLPDLTGKVFLDVGSRLGAVLYGAYYCSSAARIIGVEINEDLCKLQQLIVDKYALYDRIQVICNDICNAPEIIHEANVIFFNNVFEAFMSKEAQHKIWMLLRNAINVPGTIIVTVPSLEETLGKLQINIDLTSWLKPILTQNVEDIQITDDPNLLSEICSYVVL